MSLCSTLSACGKASQWLLALQLFRNTKARIASLLHPYESL